jgi:hypothetical protein
MGTTRGVAASRSTGALPVCRGVVEANVAGWLAFKFVVDTWCLELLSACCGGSNGPLALSALKLAPSGDLKVQAPGWNAAMLA